MRKRVCSIQWYDMIGYDIWHKIHVIWYDMKYMIYDIMWNEIWYMILYDMKLYDMIWLIWYMIWYDMIRYDIWCDAM
jgi:hypothetical protein